MSQNEQTLLNVTRTAQSVFNWIQDKCENRASGEELKILPEMIKGAAELGNLVHRLMEDGYLK
jgi:hypothetical protein